MYMYKAFKSPYNYYVYDANKNIIMKINKTEYEVLERIYNGNVLDGDMDILKAFQRNGLCKKTNVTEIRHPEEPNLSHYFDNMLTRLYLQLTQNCNLRCEYCAYSGLYENRNHSNKVMSYDVAKMAVDYFVEHSKDLPRCDIGFYGGEPFLEFKLMKDIVKYIKSNYPEKNITYTVTTNGTLLTLEVIEFLVNNDFSLLISLDGHKDCQDSKRKFVNGKGTFDTIIKNLRTIQNKYPNYFSKVLINSVVAPESDFACITEFFSADEVVKDLGVISGIVSDNYISDKMYYPDKYFMVQRFETFKAMLWSIGKIDLEKVSKIFVRWRGQIADKYRLLRHLGQLQSCHHPGGPCIPGKHRLFLDTDGNFFPCEKVSEKSKVMKIGTLQNGIDLEKVKAMINVAQCTKEECMNCWCFSLCAQCASNADDLTENFSKEKRLSRCELIKNFIIEDFLDICYLKENGFNFEEGVIEI
ncbi:Cys-rich peptide radical SAM maturase CcpM [Clostridiaceae bacterium M8S5]|nr:Cys-rich peptide radical SAM maturase CcpM [Clostridiaceae bacterium M8S5]